MTYRQMALTNCQNFVEKDVDKGTYWGASPGSYTVRGTSAPVAGSLGPEDGKEVDSNPPSLAKGRVGLRSGRNREQEQLWNKQARRTKF